MLSINWPRAYNNPGGASAFFVDQARRPPRTAKFTVVPNATFGGQLSLDGVNEYPIIWDTLTEGSSVPKVDQQIVDTLRTLVASGINGIRMGAFTGKYDTETGYNWGVWDYSESDASYANRWAMSETMLVQLDKVVAWGLDAGIECFWMSVEAFDDIINRHPNQRPQGAYQGRGMGWSSEYDQMAWDVHSRIYKRVNTITGERYCDNGRIIWGFDNEVGPSDSGQRTTKSSWGGSSVTGTLSSGSAVVTGISSTTNLRTGWGVSGTGIQSGTTIQSIDSASQITLSLTATANGAQTLTLSMPWFEKIIESIPDSYGSNGYWRTELAAKWAAFWPAWAAANSPGWTPPGGWNGCVPRNSVFAALALDSNDRNAVLDFWGQMDVEHVQRTIDYYQADNPDVVLMLGTWNYCSSLAWTQHGRTGNFMVDTHVYYPDDLGAGVKVGTSVTRRSAFNSSWNYVGNGCAMSENLLGLRTEDLCYAATEEGQYAPNGWRYERLAVSVILSCRMRHSIGIVGWSQQVTTDQLLNDGRNQPGDHQDAGSQCNRLMRLCIAPIVRHRFFSPMSGTPFIVRATAASIRAKNHSNGSNGFPPLRFNANSTFDGSEHAHWANTPVLFDVADDNTPTTDFTAYPKILDATMNSPGVYLINTADEKIHVRHDHGIQAMSRYINWFIGEMSASPVFAMALSISSLAAAITRAHLCIRSDGPWPLFEGSWTMFVHGSDYSLDLVRRGSDYALDGPGNVGEAAWLSNSDQRTVYYTASNSQTWSNGGPTDQRLMMPESFNVALDTSAASGVFASLEQQVFRVGNDGLPVRVQTSFGSGITSFSYDATCPVYKGGPLRRTTSTRGHRR